MKKKHDAKVKLCHDNDDDDQIGQIHFVNARNSLHEHFNLVPFIFFSVFVVSTQFSKVFLFFSSFSLFLFQKVTLFQNLRLNEFPTYFMA